MVGAAGFEPATSRTPSVRATRLRHAPTDDSDEFSTAASAIQFNSNGEIYQTLMFLECFFELQHMHLSNSQCAFGRETAVFFDPMM